MQAGFALIESGAVRRKNRSAVIVKSLLNTIVAVIAFWLVGYGFGFANPKYFIGHDSNYFASFLYESIPEDNFLTWDIQMAYALVAVCAF